MGGGGDESRNEDEEIYFVFCEIERVRDSERDRITDDKSKKT